MSKMQSQAEPSCGPDTIKQLFSPRNSPRDAICAQDFLGRANFSFGGA